jgi:hypothetical protein
LLTVIVGLLLTYCPVFNLIPAVCVHQAAYEGWREDVESLPTGCPLLTLIVGL